MTQQLKTFPNGFRSWMETHHEVVDFISSDAIRGDTEVCRTRAQYGSAALYDLAEKWTDEFEELNKGREWDGEFFDEVYEFCEKQNTIN